MIEHKGRPAFSASLASLGLEPGSTILVLVEMSDEPFEQWWPATVQAAAAAAAWPCTLTLTLTTDPNPDL